jgi:hypothetical protein
LAIANVTETAEKRKMAPDLMAGITNDYKSGNWVWP